MRRYSSWQTAKLLRKLAAEVRKTARSTEEDAIHDLRVTIRRLRACLRLFSQFYPGRARKELNREVKTLMHAAGDVRDRDIAMAFLKDTGVAADSTPMRRLREQRQRAAGALQEALEDWKGPGVSRKWRKRLEL
jgi:CHAD domain-containing protein